MRNTFKKGERLKSRKLIEHLFVDGKDFKSFPIRLVYLQIEHDSDFLVQAGFSVPKRQFKKAVDRNRIKRLMREAYRLQKNTLPKLQDKIYTKKHVFMFIYMTDTIVSYKDVEGRIGKLLERFNRSIIQ